MLITRKKTPPVEYYYAHDCPYPYVYWRDAQESGWVATDDGCVVEAHRVDHISELHGRKIRVRRRVRFRIGWRWAHSKQVYNFLDVAIKMAYGNTEKWWWERTVDQEPGLIVTFAMLVIAKQLDLTKYRYNAYQYSLFREISKKFYGKETEWRKVRTFFNHDKVREMIQKKVEEQLKERHIDVDAVFELLEKAKNMALTHVDKMGNVGNPSAVLAVADRYAGLIGMSGKKQLPSGQQSQPEQLPGADATYDQIISSETIPPQADNL